MYAELPKTNIGKVNEMWKQPHFLFDKRKAQWLRIVV